MPNLFDPLKLRSITIRNRVGMSPMCQHSAVDGLANDWHLVHLGARAVGGVGLVCVEATAVEDIGRISTGDLGLWRDEHVEPLRRIADFIKSQGAVPGIQISHAGRKGSRSPDWVKGGAPLERGWGIVGPSPVPFSEAHQVPTELTVPELHRIKNSFTSAADRANRAGFEFLELHAAHGYLHHSFHSPLSNHRQDDYGGSLANRTRFTLETIDAIRQAWPDEFPLAVRVSATDWDVDGWTPADTIQLASTLGGHGVDLIDCSSGGSTPKPAIDIGAGYQVRFAEQVKEATGIPTAAVGLITDPMQADEIIRNDRADLVLIGRELVRYPNWVLHAAGRMHRVEHVEIAKQYRKSLRQRLS